LKTENVDIKTVVESVVHEFQLESAQKHLTLTTKSKKVIPQFVANPKVLHVILQNLIGNAVHYTPDNGNVTLTMGIQQKHLIIQVTDTGIGIPEAAQAKIFTKLFRAENSKKSRPMAPVSVSI
jgi:signal transduction histidine kinase